VSVSFKQFLGLKVFATAINIPGILNPQLSSLDCFPSIKFLTFKWFHKSQPLGNSQDVCNCQRPTRGRHFTDEQRHCPVSGLCVGQIALQRAREPRCVRILVSLLIKSLLFLQLLLQSQAHTLHPEYPLLICGHATHWVHCVRGVSGVYVVLNTFGCNEYTFFATNQSEKRCTATVHGWARSNPNSSCARLKISGIAWRTLG
jgi:hypothetical protein